MRDERKTQFRVRGRRAWPLVFLSLHSFLGYGCLGLLVAARTERAHAAKGELELQVVDKQTGLPVAVRMHLKNLRGRAITPSRVVAWKGHFVFPGRVLLKLNPGVYTFEMERGAEYRIRRGNFIIRSGARDSKKVEMVRFIRMRKEGWWSGDLHVHRRPRDVELLMLAEDLHIAPVITWWNNRNAWQGKSLPEKPLVRFDDDRYYRLLAGEDERGGGALLYFNLPRPLAITGASREYPSPLKFLRAARKFPNAHVDIEKPFWWDVPTWLATGQIDSIGLAHNHMHRDSVLDNEAWGRPRDKTLYPGPQGNGRWTTHIYYQILNAGLRIPPSAGSASGVLPNPVGYNRVYVHLEGELTWEKWFEGLRAGRVMVTNGPLLRPRVNGRLPGHVFKAQAGEKVELNMQLNLAFREKVDYLEVVKNGKVVHEVRLDEYAKARGRLPAVVFQQSGWMLVRAVTNNAKTYRFGSTGPYYVQIGDQPRISRKAAEFFATWIRERIGRIKLPDKEQQRIVLEPHEAALRFWQKRAAMANAD